VGDEKLERINPRFFINTLNCVLLENQSSNPIGFEIQ
jgi:hypothetical protein